MVDEPKIDFKVLDEAIKNVLAYKPEPKKKKKEGLPKEDK